MDVFSNNGWEKYIPSNAKNVSVDDVDTELTFMIIEDFNQNLCGKMPYFLASFIDAPQSVRLRNLNGLSVQDIVFCSGVVNKLKSRFPDYIPPHYLPKFLEDACRKTFL